MTLPSKTSSTSWNVTIRRSRKLAFRATLPSKTLSTSWKVTIRRSRKLAFRVTRPSKLAWTPQEFGGPKSGTNFIHSHVDFSNFPSSVGGRGMQLQTRLYTRTRLVLCITLVLMQAISRYLRCAQGLWLQAATVQKTLHCSACAPASAVPTVSHLLRLSGDVPQKSYCGVTKVVPILSHSVFFRI